MPANCRTFSGNSCKKIRAGFDPVQEEHRQLTRTRRKKMMTISGQEQDPSSVDDDDDDGCWVGLGEEKYWGAGNPSRRGAER